MQQRQFTFLANSVLDIEKQSNLSTWPTLVARGAMSDEERAASPLAVIEVNHAPDDDEHSSIATEKQSTGGCDDDKPAGKEEGSLFDQTSSWINSHPALRLLNKKKGKAAEGEDEESLYSKIEVMEISINGKTYGVRTDPLKGLNELSTVIGGAVDKVSIHKCLMNSFLFCGVIHNILYYPNFYHW